MSKNYIKPGNTMTFTAPTGGVTSGTGVLIGAAFGIASGTVAEGLPFELDMVGVFEHAKTSAQAWTEGALVYWDDTNKVFTTTSSGNTKVGVAAAVAANPSAAGQVRLNGAF